MPASDTGDLEGAIADYDEAIRLDPGYALAYYNRGNTRFGMAISKGRSPTATRRSASTLSTRPTSTTEAMSAVPSATCTGAIADFNEAIRLNPENTQALYNRGLTRRDKRDREGAIADYNEAIRLDPGNADAFVVRGAVRFDKHDLEGAIADYDEAILLNPESAETFYNRGLARRAKGDLEGAIADVEQGARFAPEDKDFPRMLKKLRKAQGN